MLEENITTDKSIDDLIEGAVNHVPETPDAGKNRYGLSFLIDLPLQNYSGNQQFVPNELLTLQYFPKFRLIQFKNITVGIPPQRVATMTTAGTPEALQQPFDPDAAEVSLQGQGAFNRINKTAKQCASFAKELFSENGFALFNELMGYEYAQARDLLYSFLPLNDEKVFKGERIVLGEVFKAPFLDDVVEHLLFKSPSLIAEMAIADEVKERLLTIQQDVLTGAQGAWDAANSILDASEEDMGKDPREKKAYDRRDRRFKDAPEPRDLLCLAHTGRTPIDERPLANAQKLQETANAPMTAAAEAMTAAAKAMSGGGMSAADMEAMIDKKVAERLGSTSSETPSTLEPPQSVKCDELNANQEPCKSYAVKGTTKCVTHTPKAPNDE